MLQLGDTGAERLEQQRPGFGRGLARVRGDGVVVALRLGEMAAEPLAVLLDDLAAAIATVVFVAFISLLVDRNYTATQYALLASIGTLGRTLLASSSGALVDWLNGDWELFFIITAVMVGPALFLLWWMRGTLSALDKDRSKG